MVGAFAPTTSQYVCPQVVSYVFWNIAWLLRKPHRMSSEDDAIKELSGKIEDALMVKEEKRLRLWWHVSQIKRCRYSPVSESFAWDAYIYFLEDIEATELKSKLMQLYKGS